MRGFDRIPLHHLLSIQEYLKKYAYMGSSSPDNRFASITDPTEMFKMVVMKFQWMAGLNETDE